MPGVADASCSRSTSSPSGTFRVWTLRISTRPLVVGRVDDDLPVEPSRSQQRRIEHVRPVRGGQDHHALVAGKAVHLGQDLIQRLLALVVTAERTSAAARAADGVDLVDEDDRRRDLARLAEELANAAGSHADDHLDELGGARAEERHLGLAGRGPRQQRLAGSRRTREQDALGRARAETAILVRDPSGSPRPR